MKNISKFLITLMAVTLMVTGTGLVAQQEVAAASTNVERFEGSTRVETAIAVSKKVYTSANTVVLAGFNGEVDALTGTLLAAAKNAPVLFTTPGKLSAKTQAEITRLGATTVYILGGVNAVSAAVEAEVEALTGVTAKRIGGDTRFETAKNIAEEVSATATHAFVVDGMGKVPADALSVGPVSGMKQAPVLLTASGKLNETTEQALKDLGVTHVTIVGGTTAVTSAVETAITGLGIEVNRVQGATREATALAVAAEYFPSVETAIVANGFVAADALVGGYAGAKLGVPIVLATSATKMTPAVKTYLEQKISNAWVLGGTAVISAALYTEVETAVDYSEDLKVVSVSALSGKEVEVKFNKAVKKSTVVSGSDLLTNITFQNLTGAPPVASSSAKASLSADGKTLTVVPQLSEYFNGDYAVTITKLVQDANNEFFGGYAQVVSLKDDVRPQIASVTYPVNNIARVTFSEAINLANGTAVEAALTITDKAGNDILTAGEVTLATDKKSFDVNISGVKYITKDVNTATLIGIKDYAGNLITPNPVTFTIVKDTVDNVKPTVVSVESLGLSKAKITFSEKLSDYGTINGEAIVDGGNASVDETGLVVTVATTSTASPALNGVTLVTLAGFKDLSANTGDTFTKLVNFVADTTAPKYVSHEIVTIGAEQYLLVKYDENVNVDSTATNALTGTYVDANQITKGMTAIPAADASLHLVGGASTTDTIKIKITDLLSGNYTATVDGNLVEDLSPLNNKAAAKTLTFSVGTFLDPTLPVATIGAVQTSEDLVVVTFNRDVTAASALNVSNYKVEGVNVFESAIFSGDAQTVHLTLKPNVFSITGNRLFTISNVKTAAGKTMETVNEVKEFKNNVKPVLKSASFASGTTITATFSKTLSAGSINAFEVYKDGVKVNLTGSAAATAGSKDVLITLADPVVVGSTYQVKYIGNDFKDQITPANTAVTGTTVTVK